MIFTIQNVPIKYSAFSIQFWTYSNLQYKMFLLNLFNDYAKKYDYTDLQYKMFLLNKILKKSQIKL